MKKVIVIGQTNVGKTLFTINFAAYLGVSTVALSFAESQRGTYTHSYSIKEAQEHLVSASAHHTRALQSIVLELPWGKGSKRFELVDTAGLVDGIHQNAQVRRAMAQTLAAVRQADLILHLLDSAEIARVGVLRGIGEVDFQVAQFGQLRSGYLILANKMDLPGAREGLVKIKEEFPGHPVLAISALSGQGFKEVKDFVRRHL